MDFQNANPLNNRANVLSGNFLPIKVGNSRFPIVCQFYKILSWVIEAVHSVALIRGLMTVSTEKAVQDGTVGTVASVEGFTMILRLYAQRELAVKVIEKFNYILREADDTMEVTVKSTLKPVSTPLIFYGVTGVLSVSAWTGQPVALAFDRSAFFYTDYNLPTVLTAEPFSTYVFVLTTIFMTVGSVYLFLKKFSADVYMIHLVLMLTAQYRYSAEKFEILFRNAPDENVNEIQNEYRSRTNRQLEKELKALCQQHNNVLRLSLLVKRLLSLNFTLIYICSVFRFCFIGIMMSTMPLMTPLSRISVVLFAAGAVTQFYLLCSSVQTLLDASTAVTDKAFHENWYHLSTPIKRNFILMIMANNLECKLSAIDKFNLSLPSFMTIMNQSYSIALLFLRVK